MKVSGILQSKGSNVFFIGSNATVLEALKMMGEKNIGALPVIDDGQLTGILSERDYARKVVLKGKTSSDTLVKDIMTPSPIVVSADDTIEKCMEIMSAKKIRHLPVVNGTTVTGMISIGDVVTSIINAQKEMIDYLKNYISQ